MRVIEHEIQWMESTVKIQIILMNECIWLYVGGEDATFSNLTMSIKDKFGNFPLSTDVFGGTSYDLFTKTFSQKLAMKTKMVVYTSWNFEKESQGYIERKILENILVWIKE